LGIRYKTWGYMVAMVFGLLLEVIGYVARVMLHNSPFDNNFFLMYLVCLTIAPAFLTAAIYLTLARIINVYGDELSRFKPRTYTLVFCSCDLVSLVLQALGGGIASSSNTVSGSNLGKNLMLAGLVFQVVSLLLFAILCGEFAWRVMYFKSSWNAQYLSLLNSKKFKAFLIALAVAVVTIFVRCVYRCVELSGGFNGTLFVSDQAVFMVLEGVMIVLATTGLTVFHPGLVFGQAWHDATFSFRQNNHTELKNVSTSELEMGTLREGGSRY